MKDKIAFIYTGGTIGGKANGTNQSLFEDFKAKTFLKYLTERIPSLESEVDFLYKTPVNKFSESFLASDWRLIAEEVDRIRQKVQAVVVFHGTDTMAYTSAAISYMLRGIKIPIIFTGANYPIKVENTDAIRNVSDALFVARQPNFKGVFLVFSGHPKKSSLIHLGTRVRKVSNSLNCYTSVNCSPIGIVKKNPITKKRKINLINKRLLNQVIKLNLKEQYSLRKDVCDEVLLFKVHPSFNANVIRDYSGRGIILELYNSGTGCDIASENYSIVAGIKNHKASVFVTSQQVGVVDMTIYKSSINIREAGAIPLKDMSTEAAVAKLMWVLGQTDKKEDIIHLMLKNFAGEIS